MKDKIGVGVLGTGFAKRTQIPAFAAMENVRLVSVASGTPGNAADCAAEFDFEHSSDDWRETVSHPEVDLVCITTPPSFHLEMTKAALEADKHVLCEKPMAMDTKQAKEMLELSEQKNLLAVIDHELRFTNGRQKAFEFLRSGRIGKIRHAKYHFRNAARGNSELPWTWWSSSEMGGGALGAIGSHVLDTFRWFLGADVVDIECRLHTHVKERPYGESTKQVSTDDETLMMLKLGKSEYVEDGTGSVSISLVEGGPYRNRVEFYGTNGAIRVEDDGQLFVADMNNNDWEEARMDLGIVRDGMDSSGWSRGFVVIADRIVTALLAGETSFEHAPTFRDGYEIQKLIDAARLSASRV